MAVYLVSNAAELTSALAHAVGGDRIELRSGDYGNLSIQNQHFSSEVSIVARNADRPPHFNTIEIENSANIAFDGIDLNYTPTTSTVDWTPAMQIKASTNIAIRNSTITGGDAIAGIDPEAPAGSQGASGINGYPIGYGIAVGNSQDIVIENSRISEFKTGITLDSVDGIQINGNEIFDVRTTPVNGADVSNLHMEGNYIHDVTPWRFSAAGDHADFVHFWTESDQGDPSSNLTFLNNIFSQGNGHAVLGLFLEDNASGIGYRNVVIEGNVLYNGNAQGLTLESVDGLVIRHNSLLQVSGGPSDAPLVLLQHGTMNAIVEYNIVAGIAGNAFLSAWASSIMQIGNVFAQAHDPNAANYYNNLFISSSMQELDGHYGFILLPGSIAEGAGAPATQSGVDADLIAARFQVSSVKSDGAALDFDAEFSTSLPNGTVYEWDFGDGSDVTQGVLVRHQFPTGGMYDVTLTLRLPDGTVTTALLKVGIAGPQVLDLGPEGNFVAHGYGIDTPLDKPVAGSAQGLKLSASGVAATVAPEYVSDIGLSDEITILGRLKADSAASAGEIFRIHGSFIASVTEAGELQVRFMKAGGGESSLTTTGAELDDMAMHRFAIQIRGKVLTLKIDGHAVISANMGDKMGWEGNGLTFGNPWGDANFSGILRSFSISTDRTDYTGTGDSVVLDSGSASVSLARAGTGGPDNDVYLVDTLSGPIRDSGGIDEVQSAQQSIDLAQSRFNGIENATLLGTLDLQLLGDAQDNKLIGNDGDNTLNGRLGGDTLIGGLGDDLYIVDNPGDLVIEGGNGGHDRIGTSVSLTLANNVEDGYVRGEAPVKLTGNILNNFLTGNGSANILDGGVGADTMKGGQGSDIYVVDNPSDIVVERSDEGIDTVRSLISFALSAHVENGVAIGTTAVDLKGNGLANLLIGNGAANAIDGGAGNDRLTGGGSADTFVFRDGSQRDVVTDFTVAGAAHDVIDLRGLTAVTDFADLVANHLTQSGTTALITAGNGDVLALMNVTATDLTSDHFLF